MTVDLKQFANAGSASDVIDQATFAAWARLTLGFNSGIADRRYLNKVWRQGAFTSAMIGTFTNGLTAVDVLDDGNLSGYVTNFTNALKVLIAANNGKFFAYAGNPNGNVAGTAATAGVRPPDLCEDTTTGVLWVCTTTGNAAGAVWRNVFAPNYYLSTGTANALAITPTNPVSAYATGMRYLVAANLANSGAMTLNVGGLGAVTILNRDSTAVRTGEVAISSLLDLMYIGGSFYWLNGPTCPTMTPGDSTNSQASTAFVQAAVAAGLAANRSFILYCGLMG